MRLGGLGVQDSITTHHPPITLLLLGTVTLVQLLCCGRISLWYSRTQLRNIINEYHCIFHMLSPGELFLSRYLVLVLSLGFWEVCRTIVHTTLLVLWQLLYTVTSNVCKCHSEIQNWVSRQWKLGLSHSPPSVGSAAGVYIVPRSAVGCSSHNMLLFYPCHRTQVARWCDGGLLWLWTLCYLSCCLLLSQWSPCEGRC